MPRPSIWTAELVAELRQAWADGYVSREIAERLGCGITRNAVIGKAYRLRLERRMPPQPRPKPTTPRPRLVVVKPAKPRKPAVPLAPPPPAPTPRPPPRMRRLTLFELETAHCRWPAELDDPKTFWQPTTHFCGATAEEGRPYCSRHVDKAYHKPRGG